MQRLFHHTLLIVATAALSALLGCYTHAGSTYGGDTDQWKRHAIDACQRGDESAWQAFIERSDADGDQRLQCRDRTVYDETGTVVGH